MQNKKRVVKKRRMVFELKVQKKLNKAGG